jgi:hypothetical protein
VENTAINIHSYLVVWRMEHAIISISNRELLSPKLFNPITKNGNKSNNYHTATNRRIQNDI